MLEQPPVAAAEDRHRLAGRVDAVDLELVRADHEVRVDRGVVDAARGRSSGSSSAAHGDRLHDRRAERDVRRGVLVEERVVEHEAGLADARVAVDEGDLAEPRGAVVRRDVGRASRPRPRSARTSTARPLSKRTSRSRTMLPWICSGRVERTVPSTRRASGVVNTSSVGMFATCSMPVDLSSAACHSVSACRPIVRSVPGPR